MQHHIQFETFLLHVSWVLISLGVIITTLSLYSTTFFFCHCLQIRLVLHGHTKSPCEKLHSQIVFEPCHRVLFPCYRKWVWVTKSTRQATEICCTAAIACRVYGSKHLQLLLLPRGACCWFFSHQERQVREICSIACQGGGTTASCHRIAASSFCHVRKLRSCFWSHGVLVVDLFCGHQQECQNTEICRIAVVWQQAAITISENRTPKQPKFVAWSQPAPLFGWRNKA